MKERTTCAETPFVEVIEWMMEGLAKENVRPGNRVKFGAGQNMHQEVATSWLNIRGQTQMEDLFTENHRGKEKSLAYFEATTNRGLFRAAGGK